ncbi:MAG: hypothetical protein GX456_15590 [Verrucomicrobia bacterium]|nr:hypothetical protein [Verrucomicrobiota bacterium]
MGVGRREALGVRQLAAALSLCPNNVSVPISAPEGFLRRLQYPPIGTRGNLRATPQSEGKTQTASLSPYPAHCQSLTIVTALLAAREADTEELIKLAA